MRSKPFLILGLALFAFGARADVDLLEKQFVDYYTGAGADRTAPRVAESLSLLESVARQVTAPGFLNADGSWSDIDYAQVPTGQWTPWEHFRRLMIMARAYRTPGQSLYRDPRLLGQIEAVLGDLPSFYGTEVLTPGNWWFWVIGPALDLGPALVLVRDDIRPDLLDQSTRILEARIGIAPGLTPTFGLLDGQNLVWSALNHYSLALLQRDVDRLEMVRDAIESVARPQTNGDGLQTDASFHQHGPQLYTGGYGGSYGYEVSKYLVLTRGTPYTLDLSTSSAEVTFADFTMDGIAWSLYHNYFDVSVIGREVVKPWTSGYNGIATLLQMADVPSARQAEIARATRRMLETWSMTLPVELAALASSVERRMPSGQWPSGHRHYWVSDYTVHRRPHYFASVKMLSRRTRSGERTNGENVLGSRQSDGRFHLVLRGDEYQALETWPALDWSRLPGVTVEQRDGAASSIYGIGLRSFVGGTGDGNNGVSAMDFAAIDSSLTAKKGWVFFDDAIVFFVNSVNSLSGNRAETIVDQRPLISIASPLVVDGDVRRISSASLSNINWITSEGIGYWFPGGEAVEVRREMRTGSWATLGGPADRPDQTGAISTLFIDHGPYSTNASAEYVIVPAIDAGGMRNWVASNPITILENSERVSAARDNRTGSIGAIFWTPATVAGISSDAPAVLYQTVSGTRVELSLADPAQGSGTYRVTLMGRMSLVSADPGVTVTTGLRTTTITAPKNGGRSVRVTLQQTGRGRNRAVRR